MKLFSALFLTSGLLLPVVTHASDVVLTETLKAFTRCDASFFSSLETHSDAWKAHAPLEHGKDVAWFTRSNRASPSAIHVPMVNAPSVAGIELLSYFDERMNLNSLGQYFFWGFTVEGHPDQVAQRLSSLMEHSELLQKVDSAEVAYIRSEIRSGDRWLDIKPEPGRAIGTTKLKRILLLEREDPKGDRTRITCSLQGGVDGSALAQLRPDLPPSEYPQPDIAIGDVSLKEGLLKNLDSALLQPKFKSLHYTFTSKKGRGGDPKSVSVELTSEGGLLKKTETYSEVFQVERLTKADLIQLKSKISGVGDGRVVTTRELEINAPKSWIAGKTLSARIVATKFPVQPDDEPLQMPISCKIGQRIPAFQVFASLSGDAINLECDQGNIKSSLAFIEDLGVAIPLDATFGSDHYTYAITNFEFVR
ncbi:hypothetical protein D3C73_763990 [compost metagenome]